MDRWSWTLRQLNYPAALSDNKKMGRERKTSLFYAADADGVGETKIGDALRLREKRHGDRETLALGGFSTREFSTLKENLRDMKSWVEDWPSRSETLVTKRFVVEMATSPEHVLSNYEEFIERIAFWKLPADDPTSKWDPCDPKLRMATLPLTAKVRLFAQVFTEHVLNPIIGAKVDETNQFLAVLMKMHASIDDAALAAEDEGTDEVIEAQMSHIKGVVAIVSREFGVLKSVKSDVEFLRAESDAGQSSLYTALLRNQNYSHLVAEYWTTVENCAAEIPKVRKQATELKRVDATTDGIVGQLEAALNTLKRVTPLLRPTQADVLINVVLAKSEGMATTLVTSSSLPWVTAKSSAIKSIIEQAIEIGTIPPHAAALEVIDTIENKSTLDTATSAFEKACAECAEHVAKATTLIDVDPHFQSTGWTSTRGMWMTTRS